MQKIVQFGQTILRKNTREQRIYADLAKERNRQKKQNIIFDMMEKIQKLEQIVKTKR
jgi:hypothetical protein